jgi:hypothetical protein
MTTYNYRDEFRTALCRSAELGLCVPIVFFQSTRFYSDDAVLTIRDQLLSMFGNPDGTINLIGQCLNVHWNIRKEVQLAFGCSAHLTVGFIQEDEAKYFEFSYPEVEVWLKHGIDLNKVTLHAWLTLDSMEIVDFTWPSTRAKIFDSPHGRGAIIAKHPDEFINGLRYHPLVIDNDFPIKIKAISSVVYYF